MQPVKGFKDFIGKEAEKRAVITEVVKGVFQKYGFQPAETPVIESESFVVGDNKADEAVSDVYRLKDKGKRKLALRYEFTFQLKRLMQNQKLPFRRFQIGPVFRDEPVKGNRLRQFTTCEADILGGGLREEAEIFAVIGSILTSLKIDGNFYVNNRKLLNEILEEQKVKKKYFEQVIREIDKLDKLSEAEVKKNLKKFKAENVLNIFKKDEPYFERYEAYSEIDALRRYCRFYGINIKFAPFLARGLSYYNGTIFEFKSKKIKETICGGGAYEFNGVRGIGFGVSIDRLSVVSNLDIQLDKILVVSLEQDKQVISLAQSLRRQGKIVSIFYGKPSKALAYANSYGFKRVIFVGKKEAEKKKIKVKDLKTGRETFVLISKAKKKF